MQHQIIEVSWCIVFVVRQLDDFACLIRPKRIYNFLGISIFVPSGR
jgi:hypothetical protein